MTVMRFVCRALCPAEQLRKRAGFTAEAAGGASIALALASLSAGRKLERPSSGHVGQLPPPVMVLNVLSPAHFRRQAAVSAQLTEQLLGQVTSHFDPALHEVLPLAPSVTAQVAFSPQSMLHESPQVPAHVD